MADFNFIDAYRDMQPTASREVIAAREAAYLSILKEAPKTSVRLAELTRVYFGLAIHDEDGFDAWFGKAIRQKDKFISLQRDKEEVSRIAALALMGGIRSGWAFTPALVLAASFLGKRPTPDGGRVLDEANRSLAEAARNRTLTFSARVPNPKFAISSQLATIATNADPSAVKAALETVGSEVKSALTSTVTGVNEAFEDLVKENRRLAEEVDLLWWHLGQWSYVLDRPLADVDPAALPFVIGNDVASMVSVLPGPHGALGIIRRALAGTELESQKVSDTLRSLQSADRALVLKQSRAGAKDIAVLSCGLQLIEDEPSASQAAAFKRATSIAFDTKLTRYEIARQAYYERLFIKHGWL